MVKAKFVVDNREAGEPEDCGLIVAIGLGEMKEENQFQLTERRCKKKMLERLTNGN